MSNLEIINPPEMGPVLGPYSQIARVRAGTHVYIAGQVGADGEGKIADGFEAQCAQMYANIETALKAAGAAWQHVVQFTSYLVDRKNIPDYMAYRAKAYPIFFPNLVYPTHTLLIVGGLVKETLLVEVTATAVLP
jgi:enamine deaminase RidA (YjgF/YER057c/UK114 family)